MIASVFLLAGLPALAAEESATPVAPVAAAAAHAVTRCPGVTSVPMTADAEQALPMKLLRTLSCGEGVTVLSDNEGYTTHVRSSDGKEGFVARMYLVPGESRAAKDAPVANASSINGVVRWQAGAPGCDQFFSKQGHMVETVTSNGITVQVSLQDTGWKLRAEIAISNQAGSDVYVLPSLVTLDELEPSLRSLRELDPAKLSHVVNHQVMRTAANAEPSRSAVVLRRRGSASLTTASYRGDSTDYFAERGAATQTSNLQALALKAGALASGQKSSGVLWFQRDANLRELSLRVPVGNLIFDFPLAFNQQK